MRPLARKGLRAPQDYSARGFDSFDPPAGLPKPTAIDGPLEAIGEIAVARLTRPFFLTDDATCAPSPARAVHRRRKQRPEGGQEATRT